MDVEVAREPADPGVWCAAELTFRAVDGLPRIEPGDDLAQLLSAALERAGLPLQACDVLVITSKVVAKAEDRYVDLSLVQPTAEARRVAELTGKDARAVEVMLWDTEQISRHARDVFIVRHHGGHVSANAGLDQSNARSASAASSPGPWVLRLPADSDASAARIRARLEQHFGVAIGVVITDSFGRPFRQGTVGAAIGLSGLPALHDQRGLRDLDGRPLEHTITATADQIGAAADLVCGQAAEGRAAVLVRGLRFSPCESQARELCRPIAGDLYL